MYRYDIFHLGLLLIQFCTLYTYVQIETRNRKHETSTQFQRWTCVQELDSTLKQIGVERRAYFGGTFVGNHVHKCLKVINLTV